MILRLLCLLLLLPGLAAAGTTDVKSGAQSTFRAPLYDPAAGAVNNPAAYGAYPLSDLQGSVFAPASTQSELESHQNIGSHVEILATDPQPLRTGIWLRSSTGELVYSDGEKVYLLAKAEVPIIIPTTGSSKIEGFGASTVGGSGRHLTTPSTTVYKVTSLAASGAGTLKACIDGSGPRVCVFEKSGTIDLGASVVPITNPYITIAGQTAPSPGITIKGGISAQASNVILQHLRIRGYVGGPEEGVQLLGGSSTPIKNMVLDHCTITWTSTDELISTAYRVEDVTISNCLLAESLNFRATLFGGKPTRISYLRNISVNNQERHPRLNVEAGVTSLMHIINNLTFNHTGDGIVSNGLVKLSVIGNRFVDGNNTTYASRYMLPEHANQLIDGSELYLRDNAFWNNRFLSGASSPFEVQSAPVSYSAITVQPVADLEAYLKPKVGARPADRDSVDTRIINDLTNRVSRYITDEATVGGFPTLTVNTRTLTPGGSVVGLKGTYTYPAAPAADSDADGYTDLEEFLAAMAGDVE